ncbi:hypothetical protein ACOI1H_19120 [Loktanella sp. DJP18]|uniref:hypothetical protein n=1 Tax=Loktanella sp. DJP18 TaxID=3409788 RepID=UPI003BB5EF16
MNRTDALSRQRGVASPLEDARQQEADLIAGRQQRASEDQVAKDARRRTDDEKYQKNEHLKHLGAVALERHIRKSLKPGYSIRKDMFYSVDIKLRSKIDTVLRISFFDAHGDKTPSEFDLKNFAGVKARLIISREGDEHPELADMMNRIQTEYAEIEFAKMPDKESYTFSPPPPSKSILLPDIAALDAFLGRLSFHMDPRLGEMDLIMKEREQDSTVKAFFLSLLLLIVLWGAWTGARAVYERAAFCRQDSQACNS